MPTSHPIAGTAGPTAAPANRSDELRWFLIAAVAIGVVKLALAFVLMSAYKGDVGPRYSIGAVDNYQSLAKNIVNGNGYRFTPDTTLTLMREPGYPFFLAGLMQAFDDYHTASVIANVVLTALAGYLIFLMTRLLIPDRWVAVIAPILYMVHPGVFVAELRSGVEVLFTFLMLAFLLLLRTAICSESTAGYVKAGVALGVATYVRSTALLFPVFLVLQGLLFRRDWRSVALSVLRAVLVIGCALFVLTPWIVRNYELVGRFVPTASVQGIAMQVGNYQCIHADGIKQFVDLDLEAMDERNKIAAEQGYRFKGLYYQLFYDPHDEVKFSDFLANQVIHEYLRSPATLVKCATENVFNFWFQGKDRPTTRLNMVIQVPYMLLALAGIYLGFRRMHAPTMALLLLLLLYTMAVYAPMHAQARYSIPIMSILAIFAAVPFGMILARYTRSRVPA